jgi:hypothetical protein
VAIEAAAGAEPGWRAMTSLTASTCFPYSWRPMALSTR